MALSLSESLPLLALLVLCALLGGLLFALHRARTSPSPAAAGAGAVVAADTPIARGRATPRRRGGLARLRAAVGTDGGGGDAAGAEAAGGPTKKKMKKKKEANREARRGAREEHEARLAEVREREAAAAEAREREAEEEGRAAAAREGEERAEREERERAEREEYESWKGMISVEGAGEEGGEEGEGEEEGMLERFCAYVKGRKVVVLEEVAAEFGMGTDDAIDRLRRLEESGLTGFFDDRGKFVYVTRGEMEEVAAFMRKRGRVSIQELAAESTRLLHLDEATVA